MRVLLTGVLVGLQLTTCAVTAFLPIPRMLLVESPWGLAGVDRSLNSWDVIMGSTGSRNAIDRPGKKTSSSDRKTKVAPLSASSAGDDSTSTVYDEPDGGVYPLRPFFSAGGSAGDMGGDGGGDSASALKEQDVVGLYPLR